MKVLIKAYTAFNLGDDLFIKILCERYPKVHFYIENIRYFKLKGIKTKNLYINYTSIIFFKIINKILKKNILGINYLKNINAFINIGGSIFIENKNFKKNLEKDKNDIKKIKDYFILGSNFGPYQTEEYYKEYFNFFKNCTDICFREKYSYNLFKNLKNVRYEKDIVFTLKSQINISNEGYVLISVIYPSIRKNLALYDELYFRHLKELIIDIIDKDDKRIMLISFCKIEKDEEAINIILDLLPQKYKKYVDTYFYRGDLNKALEIIAKANSIIATRFHAMILAFILKKSVLPIAYSKKTENVLKDLNYDGVYISFDNLEFLNYQNYKKSEILSEKSLNEAFESANKQFLKLDKFLRKEDETD